MKLICEQKASIFGPNGRTKSTRVALNATPAILVCGAQRGITVILTGMEAPPNYGADYTAAFRKTYRELAARYQVPLIPFLLQGVAGDPALNQNDGVHPNQRGAQMVADLVWDRLEPMLREPGTR